MNYCKTDLINSISLYFNRYQLLASNVLIHSHTSYAIFSPLPLPLPHSLCPLSIDLWQIRSCIPSSYRTLWTRAPKGKQPKSIILPLTSTYPMQRLSTHTLAIPSLQFSVSILSLVRWFGSFNNYLLSIIYYKGDAYGKESQRTESEWGRFQQLSRGCWRSTWFLFYPFIYSIWNLTNYLPFLYLSWWYIYIIQVIPTGLHIGMFLPTLQK